MTTLSISQYASIPVRLTEIGVMGVLQIWIDRHKQRKQLARLADYQLEDMGISREAMQAEVNRLFWQ